MKTFILLSIISTSALAEDGDKFQIGDCTYIPIEKVQDPKNYTVRKIIDKSDEEYVYEFKTKTTKGHRFSHRWKATFENEENKIDCPGWFK